PEEPLAAEPPLPGEQRLPGEELLPGDAVAPAGEALVGELPPADALPLGDQPQPSSAAVPGPESAPAEPIDDPHATQAFDVLAEAPEPLEPPAAADRDE